MLSTRENATLRDELSHLGVSQISAGSKTVPSSCSGNNNTQGQFNISDARSLSKVIEDLTPGGSLSFFTSCYRTGRTGEDFMDLAKPEDIKNFCQPNALLTFEEYLLDYNPKLARKIKHLISSEILKIPNPKVRQMAFAKPESLTRGKRNLYF